MRMVVVDTFEDSGLTVIKMGYGPEALKVAMSEARIDPMLTEAAHRL